MSFDRPVVVMELGAERCRVGFSTERSPRASMLTLVGRPNGKVAQRIPDLREFYVGGEADLKAGILNVRHPLKHGMVDSWDDMVPLWRHGFRELLRVTPEEHPVLLSESPLVPPINREKMTQVLFETFRVPAMYVALQQVLTLLSVGHVHGTVVDAGYDATYVVPIFEGYSLHGAVSRIDLGGHDLTQYMARLLGERDMAPAVTQRAAQIKEELCYVAEDFEVEQHSIKDATRNYQLPDGQVITVSEERFRCPEAIFQPSLLGSESSGLHNCICSAIKTCSPSDHLYNNIILAGGSSRFPGLATRLKKQMIPLVDSKQHIYIREPFESGLEPSAWLGGAILASLPSFQTMWITKKEYDEEGPSIVHRKCDHL